MADKRNHQKDKNSKIRFIVGLVGTVLLLIVAGVLYWQGSSHKVASSKILCGPFNVSEPPYGVIYEHTPICPQEHWDKKRLGERLEKAAIVALLVSIALGVGTVVLRKKSHSKKANQKE